MKRFLIIVASLGGITVLAGVMLGGLHLGSVSTSFVSGKAEVIPSRSDTQPPGPTPSPEVASSTAPSRALPTPVPIHPATTSTCGPEVITSFTARPAPDSVVLTWTVSGGCGDETGFIGGQFAGTMYPGYWDISIHRAWNTYTDHPKKPVGSEGVCLFTLSYTMGLNGTAPDGRAVPVVFATAANVNLC
jgi:hypothetical protein